MEIKDNDDITMVQAIVLCLLAWVLVALAGLSVYGYYKLCEFIFDIGNNF